MPDEYRIVLHLAYDDLGLFESWSLETNYLHARAFLETLVGGPHRVAHTRYGDMDEYDIASQAQLEEFARFNWQLKKANPEPVRRPALAPTGLEVHCMFDGISMTIPYGNVENYRLAAALASELTGPAGRTVSEEGEETFYLETREQADALFALQRKLKVKRES
jgi:hypothetical protein